MKPDGVERGLIGEIIGRLEAKQLRLVAAELRTLDLATAERHYAEHQGKDYYDKLVEFITHGPVLVTVLAPSTAKPPRADPSNGVARAGP